MPRSQIVVSIFISAGIAIPILASLSSAESTQTVWTANEHSGTHANVQDQIAALKSTPVDGKINGTYSTKHLFDTYSAGIQHVQGLAFMTGRRYALSHDTRSGRNALFVADDGRDDTQMIKIGSGGNHPGGIQAAGKVVVVPIKNGPGGSRELVFMDCRNRNSPATLSYLHIVHYGNVEAAGIAFDMKRICHWVIATGTYDYGSTSTVSLYKSNGKSLFDSSCRFTLAGTIANCFTSQGGTQLLFDTAGTMYVAALYRNEPDGEKKVDRTSAGTKFSTSESGREHVALSSVTNLDSSPLVPQATFLLDKKLSDSGAWSDYGAGFRWGGTIARGTDGKIQAVGVSRTLTYGPVQRYARTRTWSQ